MAENLAEQWKQRCPDRKVIAMCGNLHSRLSPVPEPYAALWPSFAAVFRDRNPARAVHSVLVAFHGGSFFNNDAVQEVLEDPIPRAEWREDPVMGHTFALHLPRATPPTFLAAARTE
jgi:hypothetical protein